MLLAFLMHTGACMGARWEPDDSLELVDLDKVRHPVQGYWCI